MLQKFLLFSPLQRFPSTESFRELSLTSLLSLPHNPTGQSSGPTGPRCSRSFLSWGFLDTPRSWFACCFSCCLSSPLLLVHLQASLPMACPSGLPCHLGLSSSLSLLTPWLISNSLVAFEFYPQQVTSLFLPPAQTSSWNPRPVCHSHPVPHRAAHTLSPD